MVDIVPARTPRTPAEVLRELAEKDPQREVLRLVRPADAPGTPDAVECLTRGQLAAQAQAIATALHDRVAAGDRILVVLPAGPGLFAACQAAWHLGAAAVPLPPPPAGDEERGKLFAYTAIDAEVSAIVTTEALLKMCRPLLERYGAVPVSWHCVEEPPSSALTLTDAPPPARLDPSRPALLLYTSGSTSQPKGVVIPHAQLQATLELQRERTALPEEGHVVNWLPAHHALALGSVMLAQYVGGSATLLEPADFVAEPVRWLRAISDIDAPVLSGGPPFGYDRCAALISEEQCHRLDLSNWSTALIGADRIRHRTLQRFSETFAPFGFRKEALFPAYGLTETMLIVTGHRSPEPPVRVNLDAAALERGAVRSASPSTPRTRTLIGCGAPGKGADIVIVDPDTHRPCAPDQVGEVWVTGEVVMDGYWRRPIETAETFDASLPDSDLRYLRTGDLGFLHRGELVICGRRKELIIVRGRNLHPQDIELTCRQAHPCLTDLPTAAVAVDREDEERLVVVQGLHEAAVRQLGDLRQAAGELARAIIAAHEVDVHELVFVPHHQIPTTASGKVQRNACRTAYDAGELTVLAAASDRQRSTAEPTAPAGAAGDTSLAALLRAPEARSDPSEVTGTLRDWISAALGLTPTPAWEERTLLQWGLDSLRIMELRSRLHRETGLLLPLSDLGAATIDSLARALVESTPDGSAPATPTLSPEPGQRNAPFPLTDLQHAYLVGRSDDFPLGGVSTHFFAEFDATHLQPARLRTALDRLVARHDMLRAVVDRDGSQRVLPPDAVAGTPVTEYDLRGRSTHDVEHHLATVRDEMSHDVFPPDRWPLFDIRVTVLDGDRTRVHVGLDLLIFDVWSLRLFFREWQALYEDPELTLPAPGIGFRDYVTATQEPSDGPGYEASRQYWNNRIDTLPAGPDLPLTAPVESLRSPRFHRLAAELAGPAWDRLRRRAAELGVTPSCVLLAAYATTLGRYARNGHFLLNIPTFNRRPLHPDIDAVLGDFTSVTLLEVDLYRASGLGDLAVQIQRQLWADLEHRAYSGVRVLRDLAEHRRATGGLLAPVVFASARGQAHDGGPDLPVDWLGEWTYGISQTPQVLIDHQVWETGTGLAFNWDTVVEAFPEGLAEEMFTAYHQLITDLVENDAAWTTPRPESSFPHQLVTKANDTAGPIPDGLLHSALVKQAARQPGKTAVITAEGTLTYGELHAHAGHVARRLSEVGVTGNELVGVALPKGREQIVAALGVLLAGGAYLPVDPGLPAQRRRHLIEHAGVTVLLTAADSCTTDWPDHVIQEPIDLTGPLPATQPPRPQPATDLAYVIYTSGSTGAPKGVAVSHRAALNTCTDITERFGVHAADVALGLSSLSFDLSVYDVFGVLGAGGTLVLPRPGSNRDPDHWLELIREHGVTLWNSVPALMAILVEHATGTDHGLPLRLALLSGDWIPVDLPGRLRGLVPGVDVVSLGGATEAAIWSIAYPVGEVDAAWESIPYGMPLRNQRFHVLNDRWQECPVHVPGELFIGGVGLAEGYWNDPERTAASFVTHPDTGERLYRTGDLGRWTPQGHIEFLGREDFQVKIGGFRIELGEIEAALARHPAVAAAVAAAPGERHHRHLVGYVVPEQRGDRTADEELLAAVRAFAAEQLPGYMVPPTLSVLDRLPLSANGKLDRSGLPDPVAARRDEDSLHATVPAPVTQLEERILQVVLTHTPHKRAKVTDNFFELGLDSLTITRIYRELRETLALDFPITTLFSEPNVRRLAGRLTTPGTAPAAAGTASERARRRRQARGRRSDAQ
ncbi:non-ribosomal peptide synthetase [Streptomyces purpurogeneiscleroticus]|uniref:non-ribosomal peptide synthetase n=1 Tax=Streptomyces purpurogeneiscleroticus TaxID=68259 RepID=UPI001CC04E50|nr:non-ribosomal peptide synthetase [Streptomyces purpurogeneiscleroticus]MBZ4016082.1 hypothetical protein [Streptomyces purpurogeneiscleroticus]